MSSAEEYEEPCEEEEMLPEAWLQTAGSSRQDFALGTTSSTSSSSTRSTISTSTSIVTLRLTITGFILKIKTGAKRLMQGHSAERKTKRERQRAGA